jgi:hypothetical protein
MDVDGDRNQKPRCEEVTDEVFESAASVVFD